MSIDLNWDALTTGPDGAALAESIRDFIHTRFQSIPLPRFIKSVSVHSFDFGSVAPEIEIKDICDPFADFYEKNDDEEEADEDESDEEVSWQPPHLSPEALALREQRRAERAAELDGPTNTNRGVPTLDTRLPGLRSMQGSGELGSPFFNAGNSGIPGGTSNLNYFHSHLATGLSGAQTPLAAVAGAHLPSGWPDYNTLSADRTGHHHSASFSSLSPPSTSHSSLQRDLMGQGDASILGTSHGSGISAHSGEEAVEAEEQPQVRRFREPRVEDVQVVFRVRYAGDIRLSLTAEILLDYPMPSFVGIPVKLNVTGLSFDGVAVVAYIRKRAHLCFLSHEDALSSIGPEDLDQPGSSSSLKMGGLLQEIKVDSEIGQRENGKQVLKNVGKVEKFVLEQVTRLFEDEFVYPSFWTFLV